MPETHIKSVWFVKTQKKIGESSPFFFVFFWVVIIFNFSNFVRAQFLDSKNVLAHFFNYQIVLAQKKMTTINFFLCSHIFEIKTLCSHICKIKKLCEHNFGKCFFWFLLIQKHVCQCSGGMVRELPSTQVGSVRAYINTIFCHFVMNFCSKSYLFVFG